MGVRTLAGVADGTHHAAAMFDSVTGRMIGPIFEADDAEDQIESFLGWLRLMPYARAIAVDEIGLSVALMPDPRLDATDPRAWPDAGLEKLVGYWRRQHVGEDGLMIRREVEA